MIRYRKSIFPTHIYQYNLRGKNQLLKSVLIPQIERYLKDYPDANTIPDGWISNSIITSWHQNTINQKIFAQPGLVKDCYDEHFIKILNLPIKDSIRFSDAWFNYYIDGQYQEPHDHISPGFNTPDAHFSAIHFLQFDKERHRPVSFVDPNSKINRRYIMTDRYQPNIEEGDIIVFPCHLTHFVPPSESTPDYPRITVAFNLNIQNDYLS
jgi:hypothetical protein